MKIFFTIVSAVFLFAVIVWVLLTYVLISDETRVRRVIEKGRICVEKGSILPLGGLLSAQYQDAGGADRAMALQALRSLFQDTSERTIYTTSVDVQVDDDRADAIVKYRFQFKGKTNSPRLQQMIDKAAQETQTIHIQFQKEKKTWRIIRTGR